MVHIITCQLSTSKTLKIMIFFFNSLKKSRLIEKNNNPYPSISLVSTNHETANNTLQSTPTAKLTSKLTLINP